MIRYFMFVFSLIITVSQYAYASPDTPRKTAEKIMSITVQDAYELNKSKANNLKDFLSFLNDIMLKSATNNFVKDRNLKTEIRYCFFNLNSDDIYNQLIDEYKQGYWSYNTKFILAESVLALEKCLPKGIWTRQELYDGLNESFLEAIMDISVPVFQTREDTDYYLY